MISKIFHHKVMNRTLLVWLFTFLGVNNAFWISVIDSNSFQTSCPWAVVNENIYITWSTLKIYPTDLIRSASKLLFIRNEESTVSIWENANNTLSSWCYKELDSAWTWWWRLSNVVQWNNQYVWAFKNFWSICDVSTMKRTNTSLPSIQFVYNVAYKEELSLASWTSSYFYYPYISWVLSSTPSYLANQTKRNWWDVINHPLECHNFTFSFCWDWFLDSTHWETCDDWNKVDWDWCSSTCQTQSTTTCNSLIGTPTSWNIPLTTNFTCNATNASTYRIDIYSWSTIINTINSNAWSYVFSNTWTYTARCTVNSNVTSNSCLTTISANTTSINPSIQIDKVDANPSDLDWNIWNDTQTVNVWSWAIFKIRVTNNWPESLTNLVLTDAVAPNCAWSVTLPWTYPSTWSSFSFWWSWSYTNWVLDPGEYFEYVCDKSNTTAGYTNSATVNWEWVISHQNVNDTDTTVVLIPSVNWPSCWTAWWYSFSYSDTDWWSTTFCSSWTPNPNPPAFPAQWWSTTRTCDLNSSTVSCNASRWSPWWWWSASCTRISIPYLEQLWQWKMMSAPWTIEVVCLWSLSVWKIWVDCDEDGDNSVKAITNQKNPTLISWSVRMASFNCTYNDVTKVYNPTCYVVSGSSTVYPTSTTSLSCKTKLWVESWWGWWWWGSSYCWDWIVQRPNSNWEMEECEKVNWTFPVWCSSDCKTHNYTYPGWDPLPPTVLTFPGWWSIYFSPYWQLVIWAWSNPFTVLWTLPYVWNDSSEDIFMNAPLCVYNTDPSVLLNTNDTGFSYKCSANNIWWLYPWVVKTFESLNNWVWVNIKWVKITDSSNYKDTTLKMSIEWYPDAYFASKLKVRVSKPAVATVWWWTSFIKNNNVTSDINKVVSWWYWNEDKNKNFAWAWISSSNISSYTNTVTNVPAITKISSWQTAKTQISVTKLTTTNVSWSKNINDALSKFNWLDNVFIVKNWDLVVNSAITWTWVRTYIVEWWNLLINHNITYSDNIAFVVKWWNIIIASNVTQINWTFISIPVSWAWWKIISVYSQSNKLVVNWSLYWDTSDLVGNRPYIDSKDGILNVWTIVSFWSSLFVKQAPLVWDFIWEYMKSTKVAK